MGSTLNTPGPTPPRPGPPDIHCLKCGHALAGLPRPICPECGTKWTPGGAHRQAQWLATPTARKHALVSGIVSLALLVAAVAFGLWQYNRSPTWVSLIGPGILTMILLTFAMLQLRVAITGRRSSLLEHAQEWSERNDGD